MSYKLQIPRSRGRFQSASFDVMSDPSPVPAQTPRVRDLVLHASICRIANDDNSIDEFETVYDPKTNTVDINTPTEVIDRLREMTVGHNLGIYFGWLAHTQFGNVVNTYTDYAIKSSDWLVLASADLQEIEVALPPTDSCIGQVFIVKRMNSGNAVRLVSPDGLIDGATSWELADQYTYLRVVGVEGGWVII